MYCPASFHENRPEVLLGLIEQYPLATVISHNDQGLNADHIPMFHQTRAPDSLGQLIGHVAKNNPLWQAPPDQEHLLVFQGPSVYISPSWYATKQATEKVVPTWNYAVVHAHVTIRALHEPEQILPILRQLTLQHESPLPQPWSLDDAPQDFIAKLLEHIVGIECTITRWQGKWKVSQNQPSVNQQSLIAALSTQGEAAQVMAELVQQHSGRA